MSQRNVTALVGVSGFGKSRFSRRLLINGPFTWHFMFDSEFDDEDLTQTQYAYRLGLPSVGLAGLDLALMTGYVAFNPHLEFAGRLEEACDFFCNWAYELSARLPGQKVLAIPEIWRYQKNQFIPQSLANIVQSGRPRQLHLVVDLQEANKLNTSITNGISELVAFKLQSKPALDYVEQFGLDREEVRTLQKFQFIGVNCDSGSIRRGVLTENGGEWRD